MANLNYESNIVNSTVGDLNNICNEWDSLISDISSSTNMLISCNGFDKYIGGVTESSFSSMVMECQDSNKYLINIIRRMQVAILEYNNDEEAIEKFLSELSEDEYKDVINFNNGLENGSEGKASNIFNGFVSTLATIGLGFVEGAATVAETAGDLITMAFTSLLSINVLVHKIATGEDLSNQILEESKARISEKQVENIFNSLYENTNIGRKIKANAYGFDTVRSVSKGVGYVAGMYAVGSTFGAFNKYLNAGSQGLLSFTNGVADSWHENASTMGGFAYGFTSVFWDASKFEIGNTIAKTGLIKLPNSSGLFRKAINKTITNVVDSGSDGLVDPLIKSMYTDKTYSEVFEEAGGIKGLGKRILVDEAVSGSNYVHNKSIKA